MATTRKGVSLERAWEVCRLLDAWDREGAQQSVDKAVALSAPTQTEHELRAESARRAARTRLAAR
jgi:hypothetical protein